METVGESPFRNPETVPKKANMQVVGMHTYLFCCHVARAVDVSHKQQNKLLSINNFQTKHVAK